MAGSLPRFTATSPARPGLTVGSALDGGPDWADDASSVLVACEVDSCVVVALVWSLSGTYVDFFTLGRAVLRMTADVHRAQISDEDVAALAMAMRTMPAHPDVADGLAALRAQGYRLVTLTNSPPNPGIPTPLEHAGLGHHFERQFSVDSWRVFKPARQLYTGVADELGVAPSTCMMVAAHVWDTVGAQAAGFSGALITRPGNAPLPGDELPRPTIVAADIGDLVEQLR